MSPNDELLDCAIVACRNPRSRSALCQEMALRFKKRAGTGRHQMGRGVAVQRPVVLIVEDEMLLRLDAIVMVEQAGFEGMPLRTPMKQYVFLKVGQTSRRSLPMFKCRVPWMASNWSVLSGAGGLLSLSS